MNQGQQKIKIPPPRGQLPMPDWQGRCCSVAKLYPTMCDPIAFSMPGFPVLHYLLVFAQTRPFSWWCHTTISSSAISFSSCPQSFPVTGSLPMSQLFTSGGQNTGASAPASVLPMNSQGWFPLELTGLITLQFEGLYVHDLKAPSQWEAWIKNSSPTLFIIVDLGLLVGRNLGDLKNEELWIKSPRSKGRNIYGHEYFSVIHKTAFTSYMLLNLNILFLIL